MERGVGGVRQQRLAGERGKRREGGTKRRTNRDNDVKGGEQREGKTEKTDSCL